jgi:hypothetical protein
MVHTNSLSLPPDEVEVLKAAEANARVVVSGIGAEPNAYCIRTIHQRHRLAARASAERPKGRLTGFAGEILFHLFDQHGDKVTVPEIKVKKSNGRAASEQECEMAMLTTLFDFSELCGRGAEQRPKLIVVASYDEQTAAKKATALSILLAKGYITHACLAADLASQLRSHAQGC